MSGRPVVPPGQLNGLHVSVQEIAELFMVSRDTSNGWGRELAVPRTGHGQYPVKAVIRWRRALDLAVRDDGLTAERAKLVREQTRGHALANNEKAAELLPVE